MIVKCDSCRCNIEITPKSETKHIKGKYIKRMYFPCPVCKKEYTYFYADEYIEKLQYRLKKMYELMKKQDKRQIVKSENKIKEITQSIKRRKGKLEKMWREEGLKNG